MKHYSVLGQDRLRRLPLRVRLTVLFATAFFLAGGLLVVVMYSLVAFELERGPGVGVALGAPTGDLEQEFLEAPVAGEQAADLLNRIKKAEDDQHKATLRGLMWQSFVALAVVGVGGAALAHVMAGRALRPLAQITETARRVADRNLHERIDLVGPDDEIKELADTFDTMLTRLDRSFSGQRHFVANASHELRTPLAVNRTVLEVALADPQASDDLRQVGQTLLETNARSERLIEGLLTLARSEQELADARTLDLADIVEEALTTCGDEIAASGLNVTKSLASATVRGNPELLDHLALNLIQNAIRHNAPHGRRIGLATRQEDGYGVLEVSNPGRHISPGDLSRMFEPFVRLSDRRVGTNHGLGLAIVRAVTDAHGGTIEASSGPDDRLVIMVRLPVGQS